MASVRVRSPKRNQGETHEVVMISSSSSKKRVLHEREGSCPIAKKTNSHDNVKEEKLTLSQLIEIIEEDLRKDEANAPLQLKNIVRDALSRYDGNLQEIQRYMFFDHAKNYTRNLIATDNETYALMLLCWNKGKFSPIHDHPCDGCWMRILQGTVQEVKYQLHNNRLVETENIKASSGVLYMHGLHKVGNPSEDIVAMSLHLYAPPYQKCRLWKDSEEGAASSEAVSTFYSEFGEKIKF